MSPSVEESRIVKPYFPPLFHVALVNVALPFFHNFHVKTLDLVNEEIEQGNSSTVNEEWNENINNNYNKAKANLLLIPSHLTKKVLEAVYALNYAVEHWMYDHSNIFGKDFRISFVNSYNEHVLYSEILGEVKCRFYWRSDGTIDRTKTAQQLILNESINVRSRFELACMYCIEESIWSLWTAMETSWATENFERRDNFMVHFWVRWLRDGTRVPWTEAASEYLEIPVDIYFTKLWTPVRLSSFFHMLRPEERQKFLPVIQFAAPDDLLYCLYAMTQAETSQVLNGIGIGVWRLLNLYLLWPLQVSFLEIAEKVWNSLDVHSYCFTLIDIIKSAARRKDFDYFELFERFWIKSPDHLKKKAKAYRLLGKRDFTLANNIKMTRKVVHDRTKKWIRKNGRLHSISGMS